MPFLHFHGYTTAGGPGRQEGRLPLSFNTILDAQSYARRLDFSFRLPLSYHLGFVISPPPNTGFLTASEYLYAYNWGRGRDSVEQVWQLFGFPKLPGGVRLVQNLSYPAWVLVVPYDYERHRR